MTKTIRRAALLAVLSGSVVLAAGTPALAEGGGLKPTEAPPAAVGVHYFGSTQHDANRGNYEYDFWRLPPLLANDVVTVAWSTPFNGMCIAANVDDYSWGAS